MIHYRHYRPEDAEAVKAIFATQGLDVYLPLPEKDGSVIVAMVQEEDGVVVQAQFYRLNAEAHLVVNRNRPNGAREIQELSRVAQGALLQRSKDMRELKFAAIANIIAEIPNSNPRMQDLAKLIGFKEEPGLVAPKGETPEFTLFTARLE